MSAELVDPFATPTPERLKTSGMRADINARIALSSQNDPPLLPQLLQKTLEELTRAADEPVQDALTLWARWLLEQLHHRAVSGVPWGEVEEPAWSLDTSTREPLKDLEAEQRKAADMIDPKALRWVPRGEGS